MAYTARQLLMDILSRVGNLPPNGITFYGAANSITSLIFNRLLERESDLLATGRLSSILPANGYIIPLPSDWISPAEKPLALDVSELIDSLTAALITAGLSAPNQTALALLFATGTGVNVSAIQLLLPATNVQTIVDTLSYSICGQQMQPAYLNEDTEHDDLGWWSWHGTHGETSNCPKKMKIINDTMYVSPKAAGDVLIRGRYNQRPSRLSAPTDNVPFSSFFDEVYREGVFKIVQAGVSVPEADQVFSMFITREVDTLINSRVTIVKDKGRTGRSSFI